MFTETKGTYDGMTDDAKMVKDGISDRVFPVTFSFLSHMKVEML